MAKPNQLPATTEPLAIFATGLIPVNPEASHPFDSIESAYEFVALLQTSMEEAVRNVQLLLESANAEQDERHAPALSFSSLQHKSVVSTHAEEPPYSQ